MIEVHAGEHGEELRKKITAFFEQSLRGKSERFAICAREVNGKTEGVVVPIFEPLIFHLHDERGEASALEIRPLPGQADGIYVEDRRRECDSDQMTNSGS